MIARIVMKIWGFDQRTKLIAVKSWMPSIGKYGLEWPTLLIDTFLGQRETATPVWNMEWVRFRIFRKVNHDD